MSHIDDASTLPVAWQKSSYSGVQSDCVEFAVVDGHVAVRDSKRPGGPALTSTVEEWRAFMVGVVANQLGEL